MNIESATAQDLLAMVHDIKTDGFRLGQMCATMDGDKIEILYTFEKDNSLSNYKVIIDAKEAELQSVTAVYPYAFIYENEIHDLYGVTFKNLSLDYGGTFFKVSKDTPFNTELNKGGEIDG